MPRPSALSLAAAALVLAVATATHLVDFGVYDLRVRILDSASEWSYSHLLATVAFASGTLIGGLAAGWAVRRRPAWALTGVLFAVLLADNVTRLHEHIPHWEAVYGPLLVVLSVALLALSARTDLAGLVVAGLGLLVASLVIHVAGPTVVRALGWDATGWAYQVKVAVKEASELAGWTLLIPALGRLALRARAQAA